MASQAGAPQTSGLALIQLSPEAAENAHTIAKWLNSQVETHRLQLAQSIFHQLLQDASKGQGSGKAGAPCQKLCGFVQQCLKSQDEPVRLWAFSEGVSLKLFEFYLEWYEHDPHRTMRLVLEVLSITVVRNPAPETRESLKVQMLETLLAVITHKSTRLVIKSALQLFAHFLAKHLATAVDISLAYRRIEPTVAAAADLDLWRSIVLQLLSWMDLSYVCPLVGKCATNIFHELHGPNATQPILTVESWQEWLQEATSRNPTILEDMKNYVLVPLFQTERASALAFLEYLNRAELPSSLEGRDAADPSLLFRLSALELGKKSGLVDEPSDQSQQSSSTSKIALDGTLLAALLVHPSNTIRCCAFSLLVCSPSTTTALSPTALELLRKHLGPFLADYDPKLRYEIQGYTNKLVRRVKNVINVARRTLQRLGADQSQLSQPPKIKFGPEAAIKGAEEATAILETHSAFLVWYLTFLKEQLVPTASYQRHVSGLKCLTAVLKVAKPEIGTAEESIDPAVLATVSSDPTWIRLLFDLILDPFDDVRENATQVLAFFPDEVVRVGRPLESRSGSLYEQLEVFSRRAHDLSTKTGRADHGDGVARSQGLLSRWANGPEAKLAILSACLDRLEDKLTLAELDLGHAAIENPVHGDFASISYIWQVLIQESYPEALTNDLHAFQRRVFEGCQRVWLTVRHVLCDDSPEGHLPEELEEIEGLDTKDLLSYSFRAVHESSNLMRHIVGSLKGGLKAGTILPTFDLFRDVGNLTFKQLSTLRHRGAFSTVSLTFATCCQLTNNVKRAFPDIPNSGNLLREWYKGALSCIINQASTTRRSAGIPALTSGILSANADSPSFSEVFMELEEIARKPARVEETDGSNLPQVHALNCLRDVFRSSLLSKKGETYLPETLHLAANNLRSEVWAIRNCGLLLLRSLIDVLLGVGDSKTSLEAGWDGQAVRISYAKYHTLPGVLLDLLKSAEQNLKAVDQTSTAEAVFPALDIIRRAGPPDEHRDELCRLTETYLGSHLWHVREIAARTLCSFFLPAEGFSEIERLLKSATSRSNHLHGVLMTTKFLLSRKVELGRSVTTEQLTGLVASTQSLVLTSIPYKTSSEVRAAYLEVINLVISIDTSVNPWQTERLDLGSLSTTTSALLDYELVTAVVHQTFQAGDVTELSEQLATTLERDANAACKMLEVIPEIWVFKAEDFEHRNRVYSQLCSMYLRVIGQTIDPEPRTLALLNLVPLMQDLIRDNLLDQIPKSDELSHMWQLLQVAPINPTLSYAILAASGPVMATLASRAAGDTRKVGPVLHSWGWMISRALDIDESYDTRLAAAEALESFSLGLKTHPTDSTYLPFLSALYDALNDDDDDMRDIAAKATASILGTSRGPLEAGESLLEWLLVTFNNSVEFRAYVVQRIVGDPVNFGSEVSEVVPADTQLQKALDFDDSLFAAEDQNLFIEEVREARRWCRVFNGLPYGETEASLQMLSRWTETGLRYLTQLAGTDDGPLGWTTDQHVFAICVRIIMCASALAKRDASLPVVGLLNQLRATGEKHRLHGFLISLL
ncbi:hypothetical protein GQ53DRAFT_841869 [Thozetella sp. PMI_491]|nr:hypothetical protein GQ53DRAFT_841869 [Thozetella sp. PMI_491]